MVCGDTPPLGGCIDGSVDEWVMCVGQWVGSCQITRNSINHTLIEIIQFSLKIFVLWRHPHPIPPTQLPTPLDYTQISNQFNRSWINWDNSILFEDLNSVESLELESCHITKNQINHNLIEIIQFFFEDFRFMESLMGGCVGGCVYGHFDIFWLLPKPPQPFTGLFFCIFVPYFTWHTIYLLFFII